MHGFVNRSSSDDRERGAPAVLCALRAARPANQSRAAARPAAAGSRSDEATHRDSVTPMSHQPPARPFVFQMVLRLQYTKTNTDSI